MAAAAAQAPPRRNETEPEEGSPRRASPRAASRGASRASPLRAETGGDEYDDDDRSLISEGKSVGMERVRVMARFRPVDNREREHGARFEKHYSIQVSALARRAAPALRCGCDCGCV
jgi:hypothetical protein